MKTELLGLWSAIALITFFLVVMAIGQNYLWGIQIQIDQMLVGSTTPL